MTRLNHWLYVEEVEPCLGLVVVLNESRMAELLETERKYKLLLEKMADTLLYPMVVVTNQQSTT